MAGNVLHGNFHEFFGSVSVDSELSAVNSNLIMELLSLLCLVWSAGEWNDRKRPGRAIMSYVDF
jgi:hypothetical protein